MRTLLCAIVAGALAFSQQVPAPASQSARRASAAVAMASSSKATGATQTPSVLVREEIAVPIGEVTERWALVWQRPPAAACGTESVDGALTCPCSGFAYGERGDLALVRRRAGRPDERLALTPLFADEENLGHGEALVQRWPVLEADYSADGSRDLAPAIRARRTTRVMHVGDYDHDGRATEFVLQVGTLPCGKHQSVLVGVSAANPALHAFASVAHPEHPLVLDTRLWALLRRSMRPATGVEWACGDHGAETRSEVRLWAGPAGIDGTRSEYRCTTRGAKGRLVSTERI